MTNEEVQPQVAKDEGATASASTSASANTSGAPASTADTDAAATSASAAAALADADCLCDQYAANAQSGHRPLEAFPSANAEDLIPRISPLRGMGMVAIFAVLLEGVIVAALIGFALIGGTQIQVDGTGSDIRYILPANSMEAIALLALLLAIVVSVMIERTIVRQMRRMTWYMNRLAEGCFQVRMPPPGYFVIGEAKQFTKSFNIAAQELSSIETMRSNFISDFSHEFRTPISSINGFAQLLRDPSLSAEERNEYLDIIIEESKRLSNLSEDILSLSRMESAAILPNREMVDVAEGLRRSIAIVGVKAAEKGVNIDFDIKECQTMGNADYLSQLWTNILGNAVKFTPAGGQVSVNLAVKQGSARKTGTGKASSKDADTGDVIVCTIADTGCGMDEATLQHLYDRFYQGDTSHKEEGNGLGLALCKRIVSLHGGTIAAQSIQGRGSTFTVTLPCTK